MNAEDGGNFVERNPSDHQISLVLFIFSPLMYFVTLIHYSGLDTKSATIVAE